MTITIRVTIEGGESISEVARLHRDELRAGNLGLTLAEAKAPEFSGYIEANRAFMRIYGDRWHNGDAISTAFVESAVKSDRQSAFREKAANALDGAWGPSSPADSYPCAQRRMARDPGALESRHGGSGLRTPLSTRFFPVSFLRLTHVSSSHIIETQGRWQ